MVITQATTQQVIIKVRFRPSANYGTYTAIWKGQEVDNLGNQLQLLSSDSVYLNYLTAIYGCTDCTMWNYDPLATIDDGSCIYCNLTVVASIQNVSCWDDTDGVVSIGVDDYINVLQYNFAIRWGC